MKNATAYPLCWPSGWPRTESAKRERGNFKTTLNSSMVNLRDELRRLGAKDVLLSSNVTLGSENPRDVGVAVYFAYDGDSTCIPCDRWLSVAANVQAIAKTVEAMRGIDRWGAKHMVKAAFRGFLALENATSPARNCWTVLEIRPGSDRAAIEAAYRKLSQTRHPDRGGTQEAQAELNRAREEALAAL